MALRDAFMESLELVLGSDNTQAGVAQLRALGGNAGRRARNFYIGAPSYTEG